MTDPTAYLRYRVRILPNQLAAARTRVVHLEREAIRYGFIDLLADAPLAGRYALASIADSEAVLNSYAAPEWSELDENWHVCVAVLIRKMLASACYTAHSPHTALR